ncbi:hypothetical protein C8J57DRAFT_1250540 [Mycena rebaudengoi]|nr:hypothetical protein C8J57DRAFT_1250540 [Mycena rebaudengoi]
MGSAAVGCRVGCLALLPAFVGACGSLIAVAVVDASEQISTMSMSTSGVVDGGTVASTKGDASGAGEEDRQGALEEVGDESGENNGDGGNEQSSSKSSQREFEEKRRVFCPPRMQKDRERVAIEHYGQIQRTARSRTSCTRGGQTKAQLGWQPEWHEWREEKRDWRHKCLQKFFWEKADVRADVGRTTKIVVKLARRRWIGDLTSNLEQMELYDFIQTVSLSEKWFPVASPFAQYRSPYGDVRVEKKLQNVRLLTFTNKLKQTCLGSRWFGAHNCEGHRTQYIKVN